MTDLTTLPTDAATDPAGGTTEDDRRRAQRDRDLATPHGWLTLVGYHWLPSTPGALADAPGRWWSDGVAAHHEPADGGPTTSFEVAEAGSLVVGTYLPPGRREARADQETTEVALELVRRTGRYAIRRRDPLAPTRATFTGVRTYDHDPAWVQDVAPRWYDAPRTVVVGAARAGLRHEVTTLGEVDLDVAGRRTTLVLTGHPGGGATLLFSDEADDVAPWRVLTLDAAPGDATVRLDLNRAVNLPFAFTEHGTCPAPVPGNHVPAPVHAGERRPS